MKKVVVQQEFTTLSGVKFYPYTLLTLEEYTGVVMYYLVAHIEVFPAPTFNHVGVLLTAYDVHTYTTPVISRDPNPDIGCIHEPAVYDSGITMYTYCKKCDKKLGDSL